MYFQISSTSERAPYPAQPSLAIAGRTVEANVHVVVVWFRIGRLPNHEGRARHQRRMPPLDRRRAQQGCGEVFCTQIDCTSTSGSDKSARTKPNCAERRTYNPSPTGSGARVPCGGDHRSARPSDAK